MNTPTAWEFVEKYYPNYYSSNEIAENEDLGKILNGELDGNAEELYKKEIEEQRIHFGGRLNEEELENEVLKVFEAQKNASDAGIYEKAIVAYLESCRKKTHFLLGSVVVKEYQENGIESVCALFKTEQEENSYLTEGDTFVHTEGITTPIEFAIALQGWEEFVEISEEEYKILTK
jgi:hypothetical protein